VLQHKGAIASVERIYITGATIPDAIVERLIARRGSEGCFADLDRRAPRSL